MPNSTNPQNLNRYSYVTNNPLRYTDPTGHMQYEDDVYTDNDGKCDKNDKGCNDIVKRIKKKKDKKVRDPWDDAWDAWITDSYPWSFPVAPSWGDQGPKEIDPVEFEQMLKTVGDDLQGFPTLGWYDTPFYNAGGDLTGIACVNGNCYDRSELNYIGEGEALAKMGFSREATQDIVWAWKNKGNIAWCGLGVECSFSEPSQGTIEMTDIGWNYYTQHYGGAPYPGPMWP